MIANKAENIGRLKATLASPGWEVVKATLSDLIMRDLELLSALKRPEGLTEDVLRGRIDMAKIVLTRFDMEIKSFEDEQRRLLEAQRKETVTQPASIFAPQDESTSSS